MYVLVANNSVLNGPKSWSPNSFRNTLVQELSIDYRLPLNKTDNEPIIISETVKILPAVLEYPEYNFKINYIHGPFWDFSNNFATGTFTVENHSLDFVKNDLIAKIAANRYDKEIAGVQHTVQNTIVTIETDRTTRNIFFQKYILMGENDTVEWKFPERWLTLTKSELGNVVAAGASHIQNQFNWEVSKINEINSSTTLSALDSIELL